MKYAVFSDIHANYAALKAVLDDINLNYGPAIDFYLFGGDAIGQGPHPNETCTMLRSLNNFVGVQGDNEEALFTGNTMGLDSQTVTSIEWTRDEITEENLRFLEGLDDYAGVETDNVDILLVHGSPQDLKGGEVYPNVTEEEMERIFRDTGADIIITGNTHIPFARQFKRKLLINAGSVGQPRDKDPRACYLFLDTETREVNFHRVSYNINVTADSIRRAKLPEHFAERLYHGW